MKRTMLLVASVLVAAVGTGVVALWAISTANGKQPAAASAPLKKASSPTPTTAPTTVGPGLKGLAVTLANPGLAPGQWIDLAATAEGKEASILAFHVPVLSVLPDGRVVLALSADTATQVLTRVARGEALTALLPGPDDTAKTGPVQAGTRSTSPGSTTGAPTGAPTGSPSGSPTGAGGGSATGSRSPSGQASSSP